MLTAAPVRYRQKVSPIPCASITGLIRRIIPLGMLPGGVAGRELAELRSSLETIRSAAAEIINAIDGHIAELQKEQAKAKAQPQHEGNTQSRRKLPRRR